MGLTASATTPITIGLEELRGWISAVAIDNKTNIMQSMQIQKRTVMKRINSITGVEFKRWDLDDRYPNKVFWSYVLTKIKPDGFFKEVWKDVDANNKIIPRKKLPNVQNPKSRLNPKTGKRFKKWDEDGAGNIFWRYRDKVRKSDGFFLEDWRTEETLPRPRPKPKKKMIINAPRRLNPKTEEEFRRWDRSIETKKVFWNYEDKKPVPEGEWCKELWRSFETLPYPEPQEPNITYLKKCSKCAIWKVRTEDFYKDTRTIDGRVAACKRCIDRRNKSARLQDPEAHRKRVNSRYRENKEEVSEKFRLRYASDPEFRKQKLVQFYLREERTKVATPPWVRPEELKVFYIQAAKLELETGEKYHVDHIIPIKHDLVCGLNVPANLQVITATENLQKSNKFLSLAEQTD